jgi:hypothetical protein
MMSPQEQDLQEPERSTFLLSLLAKRKDAISARIASGIETEWEEDEEHYQGIDDANRAYAATSTSTSKRWATNERSRANEAVRSRVFLNITAPYVDAASARVADMLLPTDDRAWTLKPTPIPRMSPAEVEQMGGQEGVEQAIEQAKAAAEAMQSEIDDCLVESNWHGEGRSIIEDSARIGSGVLKGPYPIKRTSRVVRTDTETGVKSFVEVVEIKPGTKRIDCWNFWPDGACGESIHNGGYTWEREYLSAKQVSDMVGMPGYDKPAILAALKEGPATASEARQAADGSPTRSDEQFESWIYYGTADADDLGSVGVDVEDETPIASAMAVILNDRLIKCSLNPLDSGRFPYDVIAWQARRGLPWGTGVSRRIRTIQRVLNGGVRAMMDNGGLTAGPQVVIGDGITPADGNYTITGRKLWRAEAGVLDVRAAFHAFTPPSVQAEMMRIIEWAMRTAEDTTGMPAMLQGIRGDAPDTLGGMQLQNNNASGVLRRLAKRFDDYVTEPHITRYYDWMMQHSDREDIKGDFQIDVRASSALVERDAQQQFLQTLLAASANPAYELDPAKLAAELLKGQRYDPKRVQYDPDRLAQMRQASNPVEEAKAGLIKAQTRLADATAVNKGVEGMFSATNAANQIALQPSIAPMADAMLLSAGFTDANAAPVIPPAPPGTEPLDVPGNTSPNFPPNPDAGLNSGIETGVPA